MRRCLCDVCAQRDASFASTHRHSPAEPIRHSCPSVRTPTVRGRKSSLRMTFGFAASLGGRLAVSLLLVGARCVNGFHSGAPESVCSTMLPAHAGDAAQNSLPPYRIITSSTIYAPGQSISGSLYVIVYYQYLRIGPGLYRYFLSSSTCVENFCPNVAGYESRPEKIVIFFESFALLFTNILTVYLFYTSYDNMRTHYQTHTCSFVNNAIKVYRRLFWLFGLPSGKPFKSD